MSDMPVRIGQLVHVRVPSRTRADGWEWVGARLTAIEDHPSNKDEKVFRVKTLSGNDYYDKWAYRFTSIKRFDVFEAIAWAGMDVTEYVNPYKIRYVYNTELDPDDPLSKVPFNKEQFLKQMTELSELSMRAAGVMEDSGQVVEMAKQPITEGAPTKTIENLLEKREAVNKINEQAMDMILNADFVIPLPPKDEDKSKP